MFSLFGFVFFPFSSLLTGITHLLVTIIDTGLRNAAAPPAAGRPLGHRLLWIVKASIVIDKCFV